MASLVDNHKNISPMGKLVRPTSGLFSRAYIIKPATHQNIRLITASSNQNKRPAKRILHVSTSTPYNDKIWELKHIKLGGQEKR